MMTVHEVSRISGVSIRALHHYDAIGLLPATEISEAGYRLYDQSALERLQQILLFKELEFPLKEIRTILDNPTFDRGKALEQQICLLELRRNRLQNLIDLARQMKMNEAISMDFQAFDTRKLDDYARQARERWGKTPEYREYEQKAAKRTAEEEKEIGNRMMALFAEFGKLKDNSPDSPEAIDQARKLQNYITEHYYHCTDGILCSLGEMYAGDGEFTANIDCFGGEGTAVFACKVIHAMIEANRNS